MEVDLLLKECADLFKDKGFTLAFAESVTAGCLCHAFGALPQCGSFFKGGIVAYDAGVKINLLGLDQKTLDTFTPESAEVSKEMALGLQKCIPADGLIAITGLNAPGGSENPEKPVGTIFIHALIKEQHYSLKKWFQGDPECMNRQILTEACLFLKKTLSADQSSKNEVLTE